MNCLSVKMKKPLLPLLGVVLLLPACNTCLGMEGIISIGFRYGLKDKE
jgi:hypothetical protein